MNPAFNNFCTLALATTALSRPMWCLFWTTGLWRGSTFSRCSITVGAMLGISSDPKMKTSLYSRRSESNDCRSRAVTSRPNWTVHSGCSSSSGTCSTSSAASGHGREGSVEVKVWMNKAKGQREVVWLWPVSPPRTVRLALAPSLVLPGVECSASKLQSPCISPTYSSSASN